MTTTPAQYRILPYQRMGEIDYAALDFDPDVTETPPDTMQQNDELIELYTLLRSHFGEFGGRPEVFIGRESNICYDRSNLNVRVIPDVYLAFGVDRQAIWERKLYLPWEVGKPPDWALEVASESTAQADVQRKPGIYARIGIPEYWRFDPSGGRHHGAPLSGLRLVNGEYQPIELTTEPDGVLKGYSEILQLSLVWDEGWPRLYNPAANAYLENWRQERERLSAERAAAESRAEDAEIRANAALAEIHRLREELRRQPGQQNNGRI